jgi:hypothetical protein
MDGEEDGSKAVLAAFREPVWLHLACPTSLDSALPCNSGFATRDGTLSLYDISKAHTQVEFAFLSRQSKRGDETGLEDVSSSFATVFGHQE